MSRFPIVWLCRWQSVAAIFAATATVSVAVCAANEPASIPTPEIARLIGSLGDTDFGVRQRAEAELARIGIPAFDALETAVKDHDPEIAVRSWYLLRRIRARWESSPDVKPLLEGYEQSSPDERAIQIWSLAEPPDLRGTAALCGILRMELSPALSAYAAQVIMYQEPFDRPGRSRYVELVKTNLAGSRRPAAQWVLTYLRLREDPKAALPEWTRLVETACAQWKQAPEKTNTETIVGLLYLLGQAQAEQGDQASADKTAERARQTPRPSEPLGCHVRMKTAGMLVLRGSSAWAEEEYRGLMSCGQLVIALDSGLHLAEHLHDQGKDLAAAEALEKAFDVVRKTGLNDREVADALGRFRARMYYFQACHWAREHDAAKELQYLERAIQADPAEVDTLIACSRISTAPPQFAGRIAKFIAMQTVRLRAQMSEHPTSAAPCNEFAWLVCNTKGNLDEALRASQKSLELSPGQSAYLDTLAHVYFAKGDVANAVKYQAMAVEREPHSGLLNSELKRFQAALDAKPKS